MSIGSLLGKLGSTAPTALHITLNVPPQGRALGAANDLMGGGSKDMIGALVDTLMKGLFSEPNPLAGGSAKIKDWGKDNEGADNPLLKMLAQFMDASNGAYGKPHDASGSVGNWKDELSEDNILSKDELNSFKQGLTDALTSILDQSLGQSIMGMLGGMNPFGGGMGGGTGGMNPFGGSMGGGTGGMNPFGGGMNPFGGSMGGGTGGMNPFGGGMDPLAGGLSGVGGSLLGGGLSGMSQTGMGFGLNMATQAGLQSLGDVQTHNSARNHCFVNKEDRGTAAEVGRFMDQHPEIYGKPEYTNDGKVKPDNKTWEEALSKPSKHGITSESMDKFKGAMNDIKGAAVGDTSGLPSGAARADALMTFSNIASQEMGNKFS